ncbi:unnamed protein product [Paramecium sonneborni]|uniref:Transmembrane protein n=1 Tax=Paramecium sonneborni TaxID=65129 RepID=A0A8S1P2K2_9CILI|nr:unnamed protein product [Paramecium sonneborni]
MNQVFFQRIQSQFLIIIFIQKLSSPKNIKYQQINLMGSKISLLNYIINQLKMQDIKEIFLQNFLIAMFQHGCPAIKLIILSKNQTNFQLLLLFFRLQICRLFVYPLLRILFKKITIAQQNIFSRIKQQNQNQHFMIVSSLKNQHRVQFHKILSIISLMNQIKFHSIQIGLKFLLKNKQIANLNYELKLRLLIQHSKQIIKIQNRIKQIIKLCKLKLNQISSQIFGRPENEIKIIQILGSIRQDSIVKYYLKSSEQNSFKLIFYNTKSNLQLLNNIFDPNDFNKFLAQNYNLPYDLQVQYSTFKSNINFRGLLDIYGFELQQLNKIIMKMLYLLKFPIYCILNKLIQLITLINNYNFIMNNKNLISICK